MTIHNLLSLSKDLDTWIFWGSDRQKHYSRVRTNAYESLAQQNFLIKNPSRDQLELEMKFFNQLRSKIGNYTNVYQIDGKLSQIENEIAQYDRKVSKIVETAKKASATDYMILISRPESYRPDKSIVDENLIDTQTNILDLLLTPESLTDLVSYKKQRDEVFGRLQYCKKLTQKMASIEERLTLDSLALSRSQYRFLGVYRARQLLDDAGSAVASISRGAWDLAFMPKDRYSISAFVASTGVLAGLGTAIAYNQISFNQIKMIGVLSSMVAWGISALM